MFGEIILEILKDFKWLATDAVFTDYYSSYKKLRQYVHYGRPAQVQKEKNERQKFYNLLYQLKKQGFVQKKNNKDQKVIWKLTEKGLKHFKETKHKQFFPSFKPEILKKDFSKVVIFDIPERKRKERDWLRNVLVNLNFSKLQKSVWVGETQLPEDFLNSLKELNLLSYIHIFAVNKEKTGTLKQLNK